MELKTFMPNSPSAPPSSRAIRRFIPTRTSRLRMLAHTRHIVLVTLPLGGSQFPQWTRDLEPLATFPSVNPYSLSPVPALMGAAPLPQEKLPCQL